MWTGGGLGKPPPVSPKPPILKPFLFPSSRPLSYAQQWSNVTPPPVLVMQSNPSSLLAHERSPRNTLPEPAEWQPKPSVLPAEIPLTPTRLYESQLTIRLFEAWESKYRPLPWSSRVTIWLSVLPLPEIRQLSACFSVPACTPVTSKP